MAFPLTRHAEDAMIRHSTILNFEKPASRTWEVITTWFNKEFGTKREKIFLGTSAMKRAFNYSHRKDAIALYKAANDDRMTKALFSWKWLMGLGRVITTLL